MRKHILVTGAAGFVGKAVQTELSALDVDITALGSSKAFDLCNWDNVKDLPRADTIIHLAGKTFIPHAFEHPRDFLNNNLLSTLNILEKARIDKSAMIFFSSYIYGQPQYLPIDEAHPARPENPYSRSKWLCEELCGGYASDYGMNITIFRPFNIYGPGQPAGFLVPLIMEQINTGKVILNDASPKRDYIYVDDIASAVKLCIEKQPAGLEIFNLGTGISHSVSDIVDIVLNRSGKDMPVEYKSLRRINEVPDTVADISHAAEKLSWQPRVSLDEGIDRTLQYNNLAKK